MANRLQKYRATIAYVDSTTGALKPAEGAQVSIYTPDTTSLIASGLYSDSSGSSALTNPVAALPSNGVLEFYADSEARRFDLFVEDAGASLGLFSDFTIPDEAATSDDKVLYSSDYANLQAAITAAGDIGQKVVVTEGATVSTTLTITNVTDITLEGGSVGVTLTADTDLNGDILQVEGCTRVTIRNITIDGNSANQAGAGPYCGIDFSGGSASSEVKLDRVHIYDVKGYGINFENTVDLLCDNVIISGGPGGASAPTSHGFFHGTSSGTRATNPSFVACRADSCGGSGMWCAPPPDGLSCVDCKFVDNAGNGVSLVSTSTAATFRSLEMTNCYCTGNGTGGSGAGLQAVTGFASTYYRDFRITGGHYSGNVVDGIDISVTTASSSLEGFVISGATCSINGTRGIYLQGNISSGALIGCVCSDNGTSASGKGIYTVSAAAGAPRYITISGCVTNGLDTTDQDYGIHTGSGTHSHTIIGCTSVGNQTTQFFDEGTGNVWLSGGVYDSTNKGGSFRTQLGSLLASGTGDSTTSADWVKATLSWNGQTSASCSGGLIQHVSANTRVLSLVAEDADARSVLFQAHGGWYQDPTHNVVGSSPYICLGITPSAASSGTFRMLLGEAMD